MIFILTSTSILQTGKGISALTPPHPLTLTANLASSLLPCVTTHSVSHDTHAKLMESLTFCQFLIYCFFDERICYSGKSKLKLVGEEYPYIDSIISTIFVLGVFDLELPFSDSLGRKRHQSGARRVVTEVVATAIVEDEHACIRTTVIDAAATEPSTAGIREVRAI